MDRRSSNIPDNMVDIHASLPEGLVRGLDEVARSRRLKRTQLLRQVIAEFLETQEKLSLPGSTPMYSSRSLRTANLRLAMRFPVM